MRPFTTEAGAGGFQRVCEPLSLFLSPRQHLCRTSRRDCCSKCTRPTDWQSDKQTLDPVPSCVKGSSMGRSPPDTSTLLSHSFSLQSKRAVSSGQALRSTRSSSRSVACCKIALKKRREDDALKAFSPPPHTHTHTQTAIASHTASVSFLVYRFSHKCLLMECRGFPLLCQHGVREGRNSRGIFCTT